MAERKSKDERQRHNRDDTDPAWESFKEFVRTTAQIPKEELNERLVEWERRKKEKRAG